MEASRELAEDLLASAHGGNGSDEDAAQDVALAWLERPPRITTSVSRWLSGAIRRRALHNRRREGRRRRRESRVAAEPCGRESVDHADALAVAEIRERLVTEVMALPEPYRSPIVLRYLEGRESRSLADELQRPLSTVQTQLSRGLEMLRSRLEKSVGKDGADWKLSLTLALAAPWGTGSNASACGGSAKGVVQPARSGARIVSLGSGVSIVALCGAWLVNPANEISAGTKTTVAHFAPAGVVAGGVDSVEVEPRVAAAEPWSEVASSAESSAESSGGAGVQEKFRTTVEVLAARDGSPVVGASVFADTSADPWVSTQVQEADREEARLTDDRGVATLSVRSPVWLRIEAPAHAPALLRVDDERGTPYSVTILRAGLVEVTPRPGEVLSSVTARRLGVYDLALPPHEMVQTKGGGGSLTLSPGRYAVFADVQSGAGAGATRDTAIMDVCEGSTTRWTPMDAKECRLDVRLVDPSVQSASWAVRLLLEQHVAMAPPRVVSVQEPHIIPSVPPGRHVLVSYLDGVEVTRQSVEVFLGVASLDVAVACPRGVATLCVERRPNAATPPMVILYGPLGRSSARGRVQSGHTLTFSALEFGQYEAWTRTSQGIGRTLVSVAAEPLSLNLLHGDNSSCQFTYTGAPPLSRHEIVLIAESGATLPVTFGLDHGMANVLGIAERAEGEQESDRGSLTISVPEGRYEVMHAVDGVPRHSHSMTFEPGAALSCAPGPFVPELELVFTRRGRPVMGEAIDLMGHLEGRAPHDVRRGPLWMRRAVTDEAGRVSADLSPGIWSASLSGGAGARFEIAPGQTIVNVDLGF